MFDLISLPPFIHNYPAVKAHNLSLLLDFVPRHNDESEMESSFQPRYAKSRCGMHSNTGHTFGCR